MALILHPSGKIDGINNDNFDESLTGSRVIQYVLAPYSSVNNRHSESAGTWESSGNSVSITPINSNNQIIVGGWMNVYSDNTNDQSIGIHNGSSVTTVWKTYTANLGSGPWIHQNFTYEQTAGTTSQLTFTLWHARTSGSGNAYLGWSSSPGATANGQAMWAMEVQA
jgi:hypothetical protein